MSNCKTSKKRATLRHEDVTAIIDSREQLPLDLDPLKVVRKGLKTADYSVEGYEDKIAFERKGLGDLIGCVGNSRDRFEDCLDRLSHFKYKAIVIESDWGKIDLAQYRGTITPSQVTGTIMGWAISYNVSMIFAGDRIRAGKLMARLLYIAANRIYKAELKCES